MTVDPDAHYRLARETLDLDATADRQAAVRLAELLEGAEVVDPETLRGTFAGETAVVLGPVPGGAESLDPEKPVVAAGSGARQALSGGVQPALVVSDLDGADTAHEMFSRIGVPTAVHAHGDNVHALERLVPDLEGPLLGTCQTEPPGNTAVRLHRFGGFTDGDRACFLAAHLGAERIELAGWDLDEPERGGETKGDKLRLAERLLEDLPVPSTVLEPEDPHRTLEDLDRGEGVGLELDRD
jgi:uncharacterized Rossmann fold enzyme